MSIKKNIDFKITLFIIIISLGACKTTINTDLYMQDICDVADHGNTVTISSMVSIPIQSQKKCDEAKNKIIPIPQKYGADVKFRQCNDLKGQMNDEMIVDIPVDIVTSSESTFSWNGIYTVYVYKNPFGSEKLLRLYVVASDKLPLIEKEIDDQFRFQTIKIDDVEVVINLNNDTRADVEVYTGGPFVNGVPVRGHSYKMKRINELIVIPSNVKTKLLMKDKFMSLAVVAKEGQQLEGDLRTIPALGDSVAWDGQ